MTAYESLAVNTQELQTRAEYHPPMTGLELHMEEEIAEETHAPFEPLEQAHRFADEQRRSEPFWGESKADREVEEAMHLDL
jgi:hypothetical protein